MGLKQKRPPARTPQEEENYMISIAVKAAEEKILSGNAPSQLLTHYLKLATVKERLEKEKLEKEIELLRAKTDAIEASKQTEEMYRNAIRAMARYNGSFGNEETDADVDYGESDI